MSNTPSKMPYSAIAIANAFIDRAKRQGQGISPMKMQKLIYFAHAWMLALGKQPLIKEPIIAWKFGPVIDSVYHEFKNFGARDISNYGTKFEQSNDPLENELGGIYTIPKIAKDDRAVQALVDRIWTTYGPMDALELSTMTHEPGSPWDVTKDQHQEGAVPHFHLSNDLIGRCMAQELQTEVV